MEIKNVVCYSFSLSGGSALAHLRIAGPLGQANINIINGIENGEIVIERVRDGDVVVIQRDFPREFNACEKIIEIARAEKKTVIFELDDLLFFLPDNHPDRRSPAHGYSLLPMLQVLMEADLVTVSTERLREFALNYNDNVVVLPNCFNDNIWQLKPPVLKKMDDGPLTIGYMGGNSHKSDIEYLTPVFLDLINRYPQKIQLQFWGVQPPSILASYAQVRWSLASVNNYTDFAVFFQSQTADIFVAPLMDDDFNQAKSPIKFFEYSALGAPGVFSRLDTYSNTITHGYDGLLALSLDEWASCLNHLIMDSELRYHLASNAQKTIRDNWLLSKNAYQWKEAYQSTFANLYSHRYQKNKSLKIIKSINQQLNEAHTSMASTLPEKDGRLSEILFRKMRKKAFFLRNFRMRLFTPGNVRGRLIQWIIQGITIWRSEGLISLVRKTVKKLLSNDGYQGWIRKNEPKSKDLAKQREKIKAFNHRPLISVIMPVWNTPSKILNQTIRSVVNQTYDNWEFCIADGHSNPETEKVLSYWAKKEPRIKVVRLDQNQGIAVNSNKALSLAKGEFVAFLDHDDLLAPFALFEVVAELQDNMDLDVIYSDEDKTDKSGKRFTPFFKPDFSPDYLRSINYMPHFLAVRKSLGDQVGWFLEGYDGAQDYDLILRLVEKARFVGHIPKILYHWRVWAGSTAKEGVTKPHANNAGKKALQEHLARIGHSAQVEDGIYTTNYRVNYHFNKKTLVSIIIPNQDQASALECCVNSILQNTTYTNFEIFLIENGSSKEETFSLYKRLEKNSNIHFANWNEPFNYSRINNWAVKQTNGEVVLFLNNDTQVINGDWLEQMLQFAMRQDVGAVGAKLYYPDKTIQHAGIVVGIGGVAGHSHKHFPVKYSGYFNRLISTQNVSAVTAACMMIRKQVLHEVNGFDENYVLAFGDVDLCLSIMQKGYLNVWTPYAELYHHESKTRGYEDTAEKRERFRKETKYFKNKWKDFLQKGDTYYNPNLTLLAEDFSITPNRVNASIGLKNGIGMSSSAYNRR